MSEFNLAITSLSLVRNALHVCKEILENRGYDTSSILTEEKDISKVFEERKMFWELKHTDNDDLICFLVMEDPGVIFKSEHLNTVLKMIRNKADKSKINELILVYNNPKQTFLDKKIIKVNKEADAKIKLGVWENPIIRVQSFNFLQVQFNISKHELVPKHIRVPEEEKEKIFRELNIDNPNKLPLILDSDPMAQYLWLRPGDLVKIIRKSETAGEYVFYRYCTTKETALNE